MSKPKVLFFDIETAPNLAYVWELYEANALEVKDNWFLLSFAYKWKGDRDVSCYSLRNFTGSSKAKEKALVKKLQQVLNEADILVAHNGDEFDVKKAKARFIYHNLKPLRIVPTVDTLKVARKYFKFGSNRLDSLASYLGLGRKVVTPGFKLWLDCMANNKKAWKKMEAYNKQDVLLLERVYEKLMPWMHTHPNMALLSGKDGCPKCGSKKIKRRGSFVTNTAIRYKWYCQDCRGWHSSAKKVR